MPSARSMLYSLSQALCWLPFGAHGVKALTQRGARWHGAQAQVSLEDVAVGDATSLGLHRVLRVDHRGQVDALEQAPNQSQSTWLLKISHLRFLHLQGERLMGFKCLIRMRIYPERDCEVTDSGNQSGLDTYVQGDEHLTIEQSQTGNRRRLMDGRSDCCS